LFNFVVINVVEFVVSITVSVLLHNCSVALWQNEVAATFEADIEFTVIVVLITLTMVSVSCVFL